MRTLNTDRLYMAGTLLSILLLAVIAVACAPDAQAQAAKPVARYPVAAPALTKIPPEFLRYRRTIETEAVRLLGITAPTARIAAQLHQESAWRADALSRVGASGLGQFMPATAADMGKLHPRECSPVDPLSAAWAIRCAIIYDRTLMALQRPLPVPAGARWASALPDCTRWAFGLSAYNGGAGWLNRDRRLAAAAGADPNRWRTIAAYSNRAPPNLRENRGYIDRIMLKIEPAYIAIGMHGTPCAAGSF